MHSLASDDQITLSNDTEALVECSGVRESTSTSWRAQGSCLSRRVLAQSLGEQSRKEDGRPWMSGAQQAMGHPLHWSLGE